MGMGTENMDNYPFATKAYLGIENIHVMRDSLNKVVDALKDSDVTPLPPSRDALAKSNWLKHIANMLDGVGIIARQVGLQHSHVLIHCSDGWDRTSQLSALSQLCLDPYFRTLDGFITLVEKDWLSFGHMFAHRAGHLSSEKWFQIENDRPREDAGGPAHINNKATTALETAFLSAKGFFNKEHARSRESLGADSDSEANPLDTRRSPSAKPGSSGGATTPEMTTASTPRATTKVKETAPIFQQFLDAAYQLQRQHPTRFEFNERFLRRLLYHLHSCQYGTFLYDCERERRAARAPQRTRAVWEYFLARRAQWLNPQYDPVVDDTVRGRERLLFPQPGQVCWWSELFGRADEEMNGPPAAPAAAFATAASPSPSAPQTPPRLPTQGSGRRPAGAEAPMALTGVETAEKTIVAPAAPQSPPEAPRPESVAARSTSPRFAPEESSASSPPPSAPAASAPSSAPPDSEPAAGDPLGALGVGVAAVELGSSARPAVRAGRASGDAQQEPRDLRPGSRAVELEMQ